MDLEKAVICISIEERSANPRRGMVDLDTPYREAEAWVAAYPAFSDLSMQLNRLGIPRYTRLWDFERI